MVAVERPGRHARIGLFLGDRPQIEEPPLVLGLQPGVIDVAEVEHMHLAMAGKRPVDRLVHVSCDVACSRQARAPVADDHQPGVFSHAVKFGWRLVEWRVPHGKAFEHAFRDENVPIGIVRRERSRRDMQVVLHGVDELGPQASGFVRVRDSRVAQCLFDVALHHGHKRGAGQVRNTLGFASRRHRRVNVLRQEGSDLVLRRLRSCDLRGGALNHILEPRIAERIPDFPDLDSDTALVTNVFPHLPRRLSVREANNSGLSWPAPDEVVTEPAGRHPVIRRRAAAGRR
jgi:hypothetical protein